MSEVPDPNYIYPLAAGLLGSMGYNMTRRKTITWREVAGAALTFPALYFMAPAVIAGIEYASGYDLPISAEQGLCAVLGGFGFPLIDDLIERLLSRIGPRKKSE